MVHVGVDYTAAVRVVHDILVMEDEDSGLWYGTLSDSGMELVWDNGDPWRREVWFTLERRSRFDQENSAPTAACLSFSH